MSPPLAPADLRVQVVDSLAAFEDLEDTWTTTLSMAPRHELHMSFPWLRAWWQTFGSDHRMCVMVVRAGDRVLGLAPLMVETRRFSGVTIPVLRLIGNDASPRSDIILIDRKVEAIDALVRATLSLPWVWFRVGEIPEQSEALALLKTHVGRSFASVELQHALVTALISVEGPWSEYLAEKSRNFRRSLRRTGANAGKHVLREFPDDLPDWDRMVRDVERVSADTWKHRAGTSLVARARDWDFYRRIMRVTRGEDRMRVAFLYEADEPIAFVISVGHGDTLYALKTGYREASAASAPGVGVLAEWLEREFQRRRWRRVDLDRVTTHGDWKHRWATRTEAVVSYYLFRRTMVSTVVAAVYRGKKWAERRRRSRSA